MPVHKIPGGGYQYGETGKKYYGKDARLKAERQRYAIEKSGYVEDDSRYKHQKAIQHDLDPITALGFKVLEELLTGGNDDEPSQ